MVYQGGSLTIYQDQVYIFTLLSPEKQELRILSLDEERTQYLAERVDKISSLTPTEGLRACIYSSQFRMAQDYEYGVTKEDGYLRSIHQTSLLMFTL